jgi:hypothetical protein
MFGLNRSRAIKARIETVKQARQPALPPHPKPRGIIPRALRTPCYANCQVYFAGNTCLRGVILDHSETGVRVRFSHRSALPEEVRVVSARLSLDRKARIVRRLDQDIGLEFLD